MGDRKFSFQPGLVAVIVITLACWMVLVPFVNQIFIPIRNNTTGVISRASIDNISPYTDYLKYLILLFVPPLVAVGVSYLGRRFETRSLHFALNVLTRNWVLSTATVILLSAWIINVPFNQFEIGSTLLDSFHEGEFLGFLPDFAQLEKPFLNTVLVHGYGMDVLPGKIAEGLIDNENGIALTRLFVNLQNAIAVWGYFWILWELTGTVRLEKSRLKIFLLLCLLWCIFDGIFFKFDGRRGLWFVFQIAIALRYFRTVGFSPRQGGILALLLGVSLPLGFLHVYDRAIYFLAVYLFASIFTLFLNQKTAKIWRGGTLAGAVISSGAIALFLGVDQLGAIASQIAYWGKYGRYISFIPLPAIEMTFTSQNFWLPILIQAGVLVYLLVDFIAFNWQLKPFVRKHLLTLFLLSASGVYMRITLDRSDLGHAYHGAIMTAFLSIYLLLLGYRRYLEPRLETLSLSLSQQMGVGILLLVLITSEPGFNLWVAGGKLAALPDTLSRRDSELLQPDYLEAMEVMQPEIENQSCFFNVTSEGLWYYLFDKPSCSQYSYVLYAKPTIAQREVIADLDRTQPEIILLTNRLWFQNPWDEVLKADSASLIYQYILQQYKPYKSIQSHWFWKRSDRPPSFARTDAFNGAIDNIPTASISAGDRLVLTGWGVLPEKGKPADAVYLSFGENNTLISVGEVDVPRWDVASVLSVPNYAKSGWTLRVPTASLPPGKVSLKVWAYDAQKHQLSLIGEAIAIQIETP
ncbi:MAG: hypothetical protein ACP5D7_22230, partial [Limnospira sp.]